MSNKEKVYEDRTFILTAKQVERFDKWRKEKKEKEGEVYVGAIGGAYTICFTPTGLGDIVSITCSDGSRLELTDFDSW
jgi:hypothetical protein